MANEWIKFIKEEYFLIVYCVTLIIAIFSYRKYFDTPLKYFPIIIAYTLFNELLGYFIRYNEDFTFFAKKELLAANDLIYNIYNIIFYTFFFWIFWQLTKAKKNKRLVTIGITISFISYFLSLFYQDPTKILLFYASSISGIILFLFVILYLSESKSDWDWKTQKYNLMFWTSLGLGVFHLFFPVLILIGFLSYETWEELHFRTILKILIILMYFLFSIGFIKCRKRSFS
jgi:hypothetical protein